MRSHGQGLFCALRCHARPCYILRERQEKATMRDEFIKLRATAEERQAWKAHAKEHGTTLSELIRNYLESRVRRAKRKEAA